MSSPSHPLTAPAPPDGEQLRHWAEEVCAALSERPLGLGAERPVSGGPADGVRLTLEPDLRPAIGRTAQRRGVRPVTIGLAALALTLSRHTHTSRHVVSTPEADVPVILDITEDKSTDQLLTGTAQALARTAHLARTPGEVPAALVEFSFGVPAEPLPPSAANDVRIAFVHTADGGAELAATFPADRYSRSELLGFLRRLRAALTALTDGSDLPLRDVPLLDETETAELLALGRGPDLPDEDREPVHVRAGRLLRENPAATAVICGTDEVSRGRLDAWATRIADRLRAEGVRRGDRVGLLAERSPAAVAAVLGILRAGAAYVPADPAHPDARITAVFSDADVATVVATSGLDDRLRDTGSTLVPADEHLPDTPAPSPAPTAASETAPDDAACLIYTSGSTGEPKGVLVQHRQLAASTLARRQVYPGTPVFLLLSPLAFDSSAAGLWGTLTTGGRLVVAGTDEYRDPDRIVELIDRHAITHLLCVPSLYDTVLAAAQRAGLGLLSTLSTVIVAGEALAPALLERHLQALPTVALVNEYGPTETTVWASYGRCDQNRTTDIGGPVPGVRLYVLDDSQRLVPRGATGELYIGGAGVTRGYAGRPESTDRAFLPEPFARPGSRMYRTGDLVRWTSRGTLEYLGRRDHQVKIRGHRIELGAVEAALCSCPGIRDAAVIPDSARTGLAAFVLADAGTDATLTRKLLTEKLPEAAVPARLTLLDAFPVTANGKTDRTALATLLDSAQQPAPAAEPAPAPGDLTAQVRAAWAEVLQNPDIPATVNFFELGGHSLMIVQLQAALERLTGTRPSALDLYRHTTVEAQAALIRSGAVTPAAGPAAGTADRARRARAARARRARAQREGQAQQ
ncbi:amino acid adenylation domain-containing protein [Streptomyces paradoxus]|uniref:non-ribosomal peptide synthetase n=1 Tax=Streptomyces paradoxus TaxID=66375 RepID=UPI0037023152